MDRPAPYGSVRASDAERERTMERLRVAAGEGRLSFEELSDRLHAAGTAATRGELAALTSDLPADDGLDPGAVVGGASGRATAVAATAGRSAFFGDLRQEGVWRIPERSRWSSVFGDVDLDLREATVAHERLYVEASSVFGDVTVLVPEGVVVDVRSRVVFGKVRQQAGLTGPPGAPVVVLTGRATFGDVRVRGRRLRDRLGDLLRGRLGTGGGAGRADP